MIVIFSLLVLCAVWGAQLRLRSFLIRYLAHIFSFSAVIIGGYLLYQSYLQYRAFEGGIFHEFFKVYRAQGFSWFISYVQLHIWNAYLVSFFAGVIFAVLLYVLNRFFRGRFFEDEEPLLAGLCVFLVGYPALLVYLMGVLTLYLLIHFLSLRVSRFALHASRISLYPLWLPLAIFVILLTHFWLRSLPWWREFVF